MAPPSSLQIATSSLQRLIKEKASYHKELEQQNARISKLEAQRDSGEAEEKGMEGNREFVLGQEVCFGPFLSLFDHLFFLGGWFRVPSLELRYG